MLSTIAFDADDTLWQNEVFFRSTEARIRELLAPYADVSDLWPRLVAAQKRNIPLYGFGIKGSMLSYIEVAAELIGGDLPAELVKGILAAGREQLQHPIETLPHVLETLDTLRGRYRLLLITKGDLNDQERKIRASGLEGHFDAIEIVSDKTAHTYARAFAHHGDGPDSAMMVGNSLKSDILPALAAGAWGVYVPHDLTWEGEHADAPTGHARFREIMDLSALEGLIADLA